jgi:predicted dinucleotide-binding enzyme/ketosteroid isomerase-like protein
MDRRTMSYTIVGFGKIGQALAHAFARKNINVTVASRRPPEALAPQARAIGPTVVAKSLRDALEADTIILAVPFEEHREVAKALPSWKGKTVIDATNAFGVLPEELDGLPSSAFVAKSFTGAKVVKGFNHLVAAILATDPVVDGSNRVVFLSSDEEDAIAPVADLAKKLGFAPVKLGKFNEGWRAGARTRPNLGSPHLPGCVQEGAVIDLRLCDLARDGMVPKRSNGSDKFHLKDKGEISMSIEKNVQVVKDFFAAIGSYNEHDLLALVTEDIEWIIPGEEWPLAGTYRGHAELAAVLKKASKEVEMKYPKPPEFVAQGDRVLVIGVATGKIYATNKPYLDEWVFDITVRDGKVTHIKEYIDTQALARAASPRP